MKHNYTDAQIGEALTQATRNRSKVSIQGFSDERAWLPDELADVRRILDALPEPASDDWQECKASDLRPHDRYLITGPNWEIMGKVGSSLPSPSMPLFYGPHTGKSYTWAELVDWEGDLYRIPAPVEHPDPAEHPVILVTVYDVAGNPMECEPTPYFSHDGVYKSTIYGLRPYDVLEWSPAKVVADDE